MFRPHCILDERAPTFDANNVGVSSEHHRLGAMMASSLPIPSQRHKLFPFTYTTTGSYNSLNIVKSLHSHRPINELKKKSRECLRNYTLKNTGCKTELSGETSPLCCTEL
jgi:hypothetical protein